MSDILATHRRLLAAIQDHLATAGYSVAHTAVLVEVLLERLARKTGAA